jgi:hypothetical protein
MHTTMSRQIDSADHKGRLSGCESGDTGCGGGKVVAWLKSVVGKVRIRTEDHQTCSRTAFTDYEFEGRAFESLRARHLSL